MRLYASIFSGKELDFRIKVSTKKPKVPNGQQPTPEEENRPLLQRHTSKNGFRSLIYNPTVGLQITNRIKPMEHPAPTVPAHLIYQFVGQMQAVFRMLSKDHWYTVDEENGDITVIKKEAALAERRVSLFNTVIRIRPDFIFIRDVGFEPGLNIILDNTLIGSMVYYEASALIDTISHLDLSTYSLLAGLAEKVDTMDQKLDYIISKLDQPTVPNINSDSPY